jgi:hypothetical protein
MQNLRKVHLPNQGSQTLNGTAGIRSLARISESEDIVFEGHGHFQPSLIGAPTVVSHAGIPPDQLAQHAFNIPKPGKWQGSIILMGCQTGDLTSEVSKQYFLLAKRPVRVMGTPQSIRVGADISGRHFTGVDWESRPQSERPRDLPLRLALKTAFERFLEAENSFGLLARQVAVFMRQVIDDFAAQVPNFDKADIRVNRRFNLGQIAQISAAAKQLADAAPGQYMAQERKALVIAFRDNLVNLAKLPFVVPGSGIVVSMLAPSGDGTELDKQEVLITDFAERVKTFMEAWRSYTDGKRADRTQMNEFLHGLTLKELDILNPAEGVHKEMTRTHEGVLWDTWEEVPARKGARVI